MADSFGGQGAFEGYLAQAKRETQAEARRACEASANELAARVKRTIPKRDPERGHLVDSVTVFRKDADTWATKIGDDAQQYAAFLEFGHVTHNGVTRANPLKGFFPSVRIQNKKHRRTLIRWFRKALKANL